MNYEIKTISSKEELEKSIELFKEIFKDTPNVDLENHEYSIEKWEERAREHSDLMLYASIGSEVIGMVFGRTEDNQNMTIGLVAMHEDYRSFGIAKEMMLLLEKRAKEIGIKKMSLGAVESAEGFYEKLGYTGSLLIQSQVHSIEKLLSLSNGYKVEYTNVYDNKVDDKVNQVCLELSKPDKNLQRKYESTLPGCYTQMMYWKVFE